MTNQRNLLDMTYTQIAETLAAAGQPAFRARQVFRWMHHERVTSIDAMLNLPKDLRSRLAVTHCISQPAITAAHRAKDGTRKYVLTLCDGETIECVTIPDRDRVTLCVSTQAGCALGCRFCVTGAGGFRRNLTQGEILSQVYLIMKATPVTNIVFMGMGEPFLNFDNLASSLAILTSSDGPDFSTQGITVSTAGIVPRFAQFAALGLANLAVSLNAATDELRDEIMPVNKKYPLSQLIAACSSYPLTLRERITFEYVMLRDINDSAADADRLASLAFRVRSKINLIPFNETPALPYRRPAESVVLAFKKRLEKKGVDCFVRKSQGADVSAACGQLGGRNAT